MNGNAPNSDSMKPAGLACFRFWLNDAECAASFLARNYGVDTLPATVTRDGIEFIVDRAKGGIEAPQFIAANPIDLPEGPSLEITVQHAGNSSFLRLTKVMTGLAAEMAQQAGAKAIGWMASGTVTGADFFTNVAAAWENGGAFPAMVLVALQSDGNGGLVTKGLVPFCGQELVIDLAPMPMPEQAKIAIRLIDHLVVEDAITENEIVEVDGFGSFELGPRDVGKNIYLRKSPFP